MTAFEAAAHRDPNLFQAHFNTGLATLRLGRAGDAIAPLEASVRLWPDSAEALSALSVAYVLENRFRDALPLLEHWRAIQPENPRLLTMLSLAYIRTGAPARAIPLLRANITRASTDPKPYFLLIEALNATEKQNEAVTVCDEAVRMFPGVAQAHLARAQQLARVGRYNDAGPEFRKTVELDGRSVDALLGLGEVQQKAGDYEDSLKTYQEAMNIDTDNLPASLGAARDLVLLNRYADARQLLEPRGKTARRESSTSLRTVARVCAPRRAGPGGRRTASCRAVTLRPNQHTMNLPWAVTAGALAVAALRRFISCPLCGYDPESRHQGKHPLRRPGEELRSRSERRRRLLARL